MLNLVKHAVSILFLFSNLAFAQLSVIAVGDTGKGNAEQYKIGQSLATHCEEINCQFGLLLGDNIYDVGITSVDDPQMVDKFEKPYAQLSVPFYVALGNHDYGKLANEWAKGLHQINYSKKNAKFILPHYFYSFSKDNVLFLVLDTSRLFHDKNSAEQFNFVREKIKNKKEKWVVVVAHHPFISNGKHGNAGAYDKVPFPPYSGVVIKKLVEQELCQHIDLFISGHDHLLQTLPGPSGCTKPVFVVSGTGASTDEIVGKNAVHFQSKELGFTSLKFYDDKIIIQHLNQDGVLLHSYSHTKSSNWFQSFFKASQWIE